MLNAPWFPHSDFVACKLQQIRFVFTQLAREFQSCKGRHWRHWPIYWRAKAHNKRNAYNFRKNAESIIEFIALCAQLYYEGNDNEKKFDKKRFATLCPFFNQMVHWHNKWWKSVNDWNLISTICHLIVVISTNLFACLFVYLHDNSNQWIMNWLESPWYVIDLQTLLHRKKSYYWFRQRRYYCGMCSIKPFRVLNEIFILGNNVWPSCL